MKQLIIESITELVSDNPQNPGLKITCIRSESDENYRQDLNEKVIKNTLIKHHKTLMSLAKSLLNIPRMVEVQVIDARGRGVKLYNEYNNDGYPSEKISNVP